MRKIISSYLPYNVKIVNNVAFQEFGLCKNTIEELRGLMLDHVYTDVDYFNIENCRLILRPLSDLDKEIEHDGNKFNPLEYIWEKDYESYTSSYFKSHIKGVPFGIIQKLLEWHFDINGLIERGLAIDINELNKELR